MLKEAVDDYAEALKIEPINQQLYLDYLKLREELKFSVRNQKIAFKSGSFESIAYIDDTVTNCSSIWIEKINITIENNKGNKMEQVLCK